MVNIKEDYKKILQDMVNAHIYYYDHFKGKIPCHVINYSAGEILEAIAEYERNAKTQRDFTQVGVYRLFEKDFVDTPSGEHEMNKELERLLTR